MTIYLFYGSHGVGKTEKLIEVVNSLIKSKKKICIVNSVGEREKSIIERIKRRFGGINIENLLIYDLSIYSERYLDEKDITTLRKYKDSLDNILKSKECEVFIIDETLDLDILLEDDVIHYFNIIREIGKERDVYIALEEEVFDLINKYGGLERIFINKLNKIS